MGRPKGIARKPREHDPVEEADAHSFNSGRAEVRGVDGKIQFGAAGLEVEGAETTAVFPLLGLLDFMTATLPSVI